MDELDEIIKQINEEFGEGTITTANEAPRPQASLDREAFDDFNKRNPMAYGGQLTTGPNKGKHKFTVGKNKENVGYFDTIEEGEEWEKKTRTKQGYDKPKGKKIPKSELNKGAQYFYGVDYDNLKDDKELTKEKKKSKVYSKINDHHKRTGKYKFVVKTQDTQLSETNQKKILKEFPNAKFGPKRKYGFAPTDPEYGSVFRFVERGYKKAFPGLPKYMQEELINAFPDVKFDFTRNSKYGVPASETNLYKRIQTYFDDPKPFRFGFNLRTPGGWILAQMDRAAALGNEDYEPIKQKPNKPVSKTNKIIGMIDKTGKKPKKYNIDTIKNLPNFAEIQKYYDVANLSKTPVSKYSNIAKLLPEGFDPDKILLNDLLQFIAKDKGGINRARRAIEIHHTRGVKNEATGNFQLLRRDLNKLADTIEQQISKGNLDRSAELIEKGIRVEAGGQKYGPKKVSPQQDFKQIISGVEQELGKFTKKDFNKFKSALQKIGCPGLAGGGRAGFQDGTTCFNKGVEKLKGDPTKLSPGDQANLRTLGKSAKAVRFLKNVLGPGAVVGELIFEGGFAANKFMNEGMPIKQALGESYINRFVLGPKTQIDVEAERAKEFAKGEDFAMAKRGERMRPFMAQSATADAQRLKKREEEMKALYPQLDMVNLSNKEIDELLSAQGVYSPFTLGFGMQQRQPGIGDMRYNEDLAYDEIRDVFRKGAEEDIRRQQMQSIADAGGVANLAKGGRAGFSKGSLRKGVLSLIDKSVKSTPKDTTSALDKLIKKTLDEDLFDKKDRIVDSINISEAKKRRNYPYNMRVFEEPKNLDFYRAIKESNFRTKTGPFFDRIKKAGGGILKEAGDSSGAPPESGPNPQGLQGLLNRVKKT